MLLCQLKVLFCKLWALGCGLHCCVLHTVLALQHVWIVSALPESVSLSKAHDIIIDVHQLLILLTTCVVRAQDTDHSPPKKVRDGEDNLLERSFWSRWVQHNCAGVQDMGIWHVAAFRCRGGEGMVFSCLRICAYDPVYCATGLAPQLVHDVFCMMCWARLVCGLQLDSFCLCLQSVFDSPLGMLV